MNVSICIPCYNGYDHLHRLLFDIYNKCRSVNEVVICNDASTQEEVYTGLAWWKGSKMLPIREIRNEENSGFPIACNNALRAATGDVRILVSTDVRLQGDIIERFLAVLHKYPNSLVGGKLLTWDTGWNTFDGKTFPYLEGWLLGTTAEVWEELDYFDERYSPYDMEDIDLSTKALSRGHEIYSLDALGGDTIATHVGAGTLGYNPGREAVTVANKEKFRQKWIK